MAKYYLAVPDSFTIPTDGNQIALSSACILRRDDSAVPTFLPLDADGYTVFIADTGDTATATAFAISSTSPTDNATDVAVDTAITITFNANIAFGTGNITLRDNDGGWADLEAFDVITDTGGGAGTVSISGAVLTIEPTADLANNIEYAIRIDATAIDTTDGVSFAGIADDTTVSFTTVAAAPTFAIAQIGAIQKSTTMTATPSFVVDLSGYESGDTIYFEYGPNSEATAATVGGNAATRIDHTNIMLDAALFSYTLTATGSASTTIALTIDGATPSHWIIVVGTKGAVLDEWDEDYQNLGNCSFSVTPTDANNTIVGMLIGNPNAFDPAGTWTGLTTIDEDFSGVPNGGAILGMAHDVAVSAYAVSFTPGGATSIRTSGHVLAFSEA